MRIDGKGVDDAGISDAMKAMLTQDPGATAMIRPAADTPFHRLSKLMNLLREAGANSIRVDEFPPASK